MKILVIAPHPDDEVFGCGGAMARFASEGAEVIVAIVTKGDDLFPEERVRQGREEALIAHKHLGVKKTIFMDKFPAAKLDTIPRYFLNGAFEQLIEDIKPDILFIPFIGDIQLDHRIIFEAMMTACRPNGRNVPRKIYAYETLSETNWNAPLISPAFIPNVFIDISNYMELKIRAVQEYQSQLRKYPNERSLEAAKNLAMYRGATACVNFAEAFILIREIKKI